MTKRSGWIGLIALIASGGALAQPDPRQACRLDYERFCAAYAPGTPEVEECFRQNMPRMSRRCREAIRATHGDEAPKPRR